MWALFNRYVLWSISALTNNNNSKYSLFDLILNFNEVTENQNISSHNPQYNLRILLKGPLPFEIYICFCSVFNSVFPLSEERKRRP